MAVDTGLEPAVRSSRIICFQDRLLTIRIIHRIFNLRIHFILLISGWAVTVIVIRSYRPTTYAYAFLSSNCHTRHGISVLHISLVDSDELYITFGFILLLPINFRHRVSDVIPSVIHLIGPNPFTSRLGCTRRLFLKQ